ncbi:VWA domain-containing protein [bacterium]|nr:VWA domain-containing protein [bacterium]
MSEGYSSSAEERLRRWRLVLGDHAEAEIGLSLTEDDQRMDAALDALYDSDRQGGLGSSAPSVARWLGDIRSYFPSSVVQIMQRDALERLNLRQMLLEPELLAAVEPDVHLVANLLALKNVLPDRTLETARMVVRTVVDELQRKLTNPLRQAVTGSLHRAGRNRRPRLHEIDWPRTIRANLKHYQPQYRTVIPETRIGFGRQRAALRTTILCIDQSGSMASSVVYAGIFGAVLASMPALKTHVVAFDTAVVDLTEHLHDPVELLFGTQLGGGTDIARALTYCQGLIRQPQETILILISDLYEGGNRNELFQRVTSLLGAGVQVVVLLALSDSGAPSFDRTIAATLAGWGVPSFACTPERFADLMAAAIDRRDLGQWAAAEGIVTVRSE